MRISTTFAEQVLNFNNELSQTALALPGKYKIINPFIGEQKKLVQAATTAFYQKYYNDNQPRRLILGSSPARRGTAVTGIPFEDAKHLQEKTGIFLDHFHINQSSSEFLYDVIEAYGGCNNFYSAFYMNFVCPLGIVKINEKGNEVNCNYYENKKLQKILYPFILSSLQCQLDFGIDTSVCYCIGSGENFHFLSNLNNEYHFFDKIIPLEHPRFIMQYNARNKDIFFKKYLTALCNP